MKNHERALVTWAALALALLLVAAGPAAAQTPIGLGNIPSTFEPGTPDPSNVGVGITGSGSIIAGYSQDWNSGTERAWVWEQSHPTLSLLPLPDGYTDSTLGGSFGNERVINDAGQIVGTCMQREGYAEYHRQACLWQKDTAGNWIVFPLGYLEGHDWSEAHAINNSGQVIGQSELHADYLTRSAVVWDSTRAAHAVGASFYTNAPISDNGLVVGRAYLPKDLIEGQVWLVDSAGAGSLVLKPQNGMPLAVSPSGVVAGTYVDEYYATSGLFLWRSGDESPTPLDLPTATPPAVPCSSPGSCTMNYQFVESMSVNDTGQVLLPLLTNWQNNDKDKGFSTFDLFFWNGTGWDNVGSDLPTDLGVGFGTMNGNGHVVVGMYDSWMNYQAYLWEGPALARQVPPLPGSGSWMVRYMNDADQMVGESSFNDATTGNFLDSQATAWGVTPASPSIVNVPVGAVYGAQFTPTYYYTGDGRTSATTSTPAVCTIGRGGVVKFVDVGTCTLAAHASAGATSPAVDGAPQSFAVGKAPAAIAIKNLPKNPRYGDKFNATYTFTGDGAKSLTTTTEDVCTVTNNQVQFVGVGACSLVAHIAEGAHYLAGDGDKQGFVVGKAETKISIDNIPRGAKKGGSFVPTYKYAGDGTTWVTSSTPRVCTTDGTTVNFAAGGTCTLSAHATEGTLYLATDGKAQSFPVAK